MEHFITLNVQFFRKTFQADLNYDNAKKHPIVRAKNTKCKICLEEFSGFYALRKHRNSQHGIAIKISNLDMDNLAENIDDADLKEELTSCNQFLVDSELEKVDIVFLISPCHHSTTPS